MCLLTTIFLGSKLPNNWWQWDGTIPPPANSNLYSLNLVFPFGYLRTFLCIVSELTKTSCILIEDSVFIEMLVLITINIKSIAMNKLWIWILKNMRFWYLFLNTFLNQIQLYLQGLRMFFKIILKDFCNIFLLKMISLIYKLNRYKISTLYLYLLNIENLEIV